MTPQALKNIKFKVKSHNFEITVIFFFTKVSPIPQFSNYSNGMSNFGNPIWFYHGVLCKYKPKKGRFGQ